MQHRLDPPMLQMPILGMCVGVSTLKASLVHPGLFYTGKIDLAHCHTMSCVALQPTLQPNQIAERLIRHLTPYMNQSDLQTVVQPVHFRA